MVDNRKSRPREAVVQALSARQARSFGSASVAFPSGGDYYLLHEHGRRSDHHGPAGRDRHEERNLYLYDTSTKILTFNITHTGLSFSETMAHIHSAAVGVPGPIAKTLAVGMPKVGSTAMLDAGQEADLLADLLYVNIHTTNSGSGAIRGQIIKDPAPIPVLTWPALVIFALFLCVGGAWQILRMGRLTLRV